MMMDNEKNLNADEIMEEKFEGEMLTDENLEDVAGGKERSERYLKEHGYVKTSTHGVITGSNAGLTFRDRKGNRTGYFCGNHVSIWIKADDKFKMHKDPVTGKYDVTFVRAYRHGHEGYVNRDYV
ncbi:MAG: hypothetical protein E7238_10420 [Sarcina sp.]|nr:hypothetical protein [Sarcina sp.]